MPARTIAILPGACLTLLTAAAATPAIGGSPSFDCARTDSRAEELICGDRELALMDVEATRLFRLVRDSSDIKAKQREAINEERERWLKVRDGCWIAEDVRRCIVSAYAIRIHNLRENHAQRLARDDKGITKGPFALQCKDLKGSVNATFISSDPPVGTVRVREQFHVGIGSGLKYIETGPEGELSFWTSGKDAFLKLPNGVRYSCTLRPPD